MIERTCAVLVLALLAGATGARAQSADTSAAALRGFAALERYRVSESLEHASEAAREFAAAVKAGPKDAVAHYGLALTLYNAKKTMTVVRQQGIADGEAIFVAKRLLEKALDINPQYVDAARLLVKVAEKTKDKKALARAHAIAPPESIPPPRDTSADILTRTPGSGVDFVRRAAVLYARGEVAEAYGAYQAGLAVWDEATARAYVDDVLVTADQQEAISLTDGTLEKRKAALQKFWQKRAVRGGISIPDRIAEHYRRLSAARARFGLNLKPGQHLPLTVFGKPRVGVERELDDRGMIYVRYGEPSNKIRARDYVEPMDGSPTGQEAWAYRDADGRYRVYYFFGGRLESDLLRAFNRTPSSPESLTNLLSDLAAFDGRYAFIAARMETIRNYQTMSQVTADPQGRAAIARRIAERMEDANRQNERISQQNREVLFNAFNADAAFPRFDRTLTLFHDFATFRGRGCTDVVYSVASPTSSYRLSVAVADTFTWETQSVDTVVMKGSAVGQYLRSTGVICTAPDYNAYVRFTASTDSITGVTTGGELRIPDYSSSGLLLSDLLFGLDEDGPFVRGNANLALVPPRQFRQKQPFRLFYEIYNLPAGGRYRTTLKFDVKDGNPLVRLFKGNTTVTLSFEGEATQEGLVQEIRTLAPEIEDGEVELTVTVTNLATGETATNKERLWILPAEDE